ncbi:MAG: DUF2799 domain-containing protein [Bdellovibrionales bacterium]
MKLIILAILSLGLLSGCAGRWNEKTCTETNFSDLGYQEGSGGKNNSGNYYNQACLKKKVQISVSDYNSGYKRGLVAFCSDSKGLNDGSAGKEMFNNCRTIKTYTSAHRRGLRSFCSTKRGVEDGFAMKSEYILCTSFSAYTTGYAKGKKEYCSSDRGYEHGFAGSDKDARCVSYSRYKAGYSKGQKYYCSPENGTKIGEKGDSFPEKCATAGLTFKKNFNKGRISFLSRVLKDKQTAITFERQNYERLRDDLQDTQFALNRLPKYSTDPAVADERARIDSDIAGLQRKRDSQRKTVEDLEEQVYNVKREITDLKNRY